MSEVKERGNLKKQVAEPEINRKRKIISKAEIDGGKSPSQYSHAPVMLHTLDEQGCIVDVSDYWQEHLGYQRQEVLNKPLTDFMSKDSCLFARKNGILGKGISKSITNVPLTFYHKNGKPLDMLYSSVAEEIQPGSPARSVAVLIDVTLSQRSTKVQAALYLISQAAHSVHNLNELYESIHAIVAELMPARNLYIALLEPPDYQIHFVYWVDEFDPKPEPRPTGGRGLTEFILRTGKPLLVSGESSFDDLLQSGVVDNVGAPSIDWLGVPLQNAGRIIGVMAVQSYDKGVRYTEENKEILEFVSEQVASAIEAKRTEQALRQNEQKYRSIVNNLEDGVILVDERGIIVEWSNGQETIVGLKRDEVVGKHIVDFHHLILPQDSPHQSNPGILADMMQQMLVRGEITNSTRFSNSGKYLEGELHSKTGEIRSVQITISPIKTDLGYQLLSITRDITERKRAELALKESENRYALAVLGANDGIWDWNLQNNTIYYSPRWKAMLGYEDDEISDSPDEWFGRIHPEDVERVQADISAHQDGQTRHFASEHRIFHRDGFYRWVLARGYANWDGSSGSSRMAGSLSDITARKATEERLRHDAMHDPLTGLPNRIYFMDQMRRAIDRSHRRSNYQAAILFLDLDRFKIVNDSLGHAIGDSMLISIGERLQTSLRLGDTIARLGGDEFAILLDDISGISDAILVADRLQQSLELPFELLGHEVFATVSIGIAQTSKGYERAEDMLRDADTALYRAKAAGRARYAVFDNEMHAHNVELLQLEGELRRALERDEFLLYYQPVVNLSSGFISSFEALIRWQHPLRGLILPHEFIPLAEETGMIISIGEWVLRSACKQVKMWTDMGYANVTVAVNISARQLHDQKLPELVRSIMDEVGVLPQAIHLEITETAAMQDIAHTIQALESLRAYGVQFSIDDFGTNYSSLSYLQRFPVNCLKIDQSFIWDIHEATDDSGIITAIIAMGHLLNLRVTAEGVETMRQLDFLRSKGCDDVQGYLISKAMRADEILLILKSSKKLLPDVSYSTDITGISL